MDSDPDNQPPFLSYGFRPFFLFAGLYAVVALAAWLAWIAIHDVPGVLVNPTFAGPPSQWHGHELIFGFAAAVVSGFMLTAVPNWTGARRVAGTPLVVLAVLWLAGRAAVWLSAVLPPALVAVIDIAYLPALAATVLGGLLIRPAPRHMVFFGFLLLLAATNAMVHAEWLGLTDATASRGLATALMILTLMVTVIGGRIVPSFTRNVLIRDPARREHLPRSFPWLDRVAIASVAALVPIAVLDLDGPAAAVVAGLAAAANLVRLAFWRGPATLGSPILWTLHLSYLFLALGLAAVAWSKVSSDLGASSALHLLAIGAIGGMTLAVMTRAALGHTGRKLEASRPVALAYALVPLAALTRAFGVELVPQHYLGVLLVSGALWIAAFAIFAAAYAPILVGPSAKTDAA